MLPPCWLHPSLDRGSGAATAADVSRPSARRTARWAISHRFSAGSAAGKDPVIKTDDFSRLEVELGAATHGRGTRGCARWTVGLNAARRTRDRSEVVLELLAGDAGALKPTAHAGESHAEAAVAAGVRATDRQRHEQLLRLGQRRRGGRVRKLATAAVAGLVLAAALVLVACVQVVEPPAPPLPVDPQPVPPVAPTEPTEPPDPPPPETPPPEQPPPDRRACPAGAAASPGRTRACARLLQGRDSGTRVPGARLDTGTDHRRLRRRRWTPPATSMRNSGS